MFFLCDRDCEIGASKGIAFVVLARSTTLPLGCLLPNPWQLGLVMATLVHALCVP